MKQTIMNMMVVLMVSMTLIGCGTPVERIAETKSGKPEVLITTQDKAKVKTALTENMLYRSYTLDEETDSRLKFSKLSKGGGDVMLTLMMGNAHSTTPKVEVQYNLFQKDNGIAVIANAGASLQMALGQQKYTDLTQNNGVFNKIQTILNETKQEIE